MTQLVSIQDVPKSIRIHILEELGFIVDGQYIYDNSKKQVLDRYTGEPIKLDNMLILPGSTIIIDNNPLSVSSYLEEFGDVL